MIGGIEEAGEGMRFPLTLVEGLLCIVGGDVACGSHRSCAGPRFPQALSVQSPSWQRAWPCGWPVCSPLRDGVALSGLALLANAVSCPAQATAGHPATNKTDAGLLSRSKGHPSSADSSWAATLIKRAPRLWGDELRPASVCERFLQQGWRHVGWPFCPGTGGWMGRHPPPSSYAELRAAFPLPAQCWAAHETPGK